MKQIFLLFVIALLSFSCYDREARELSGPLSAKGMVVTAHPEATRIGVQILEQGGNSVDAAVAVQFALAVCYPTAGNIGGGGFMLYRDSSGLAMALDFREKAPLAAHRDMYLDSLGSVVEGMSTQSHLASGVPGTVDGMVTAHERFGRLPWQDLVQSAVELARQGFKITNKQAANFNKYRAQFQLLNPDNDYLRRKAEWRAGDTLIQEDLAETLELIRDYGRIGFYEGPVAAMIVREMERGGGAISFEDLSSYHSKWRDPIRINYKEFQVISMPPPSSGGIALGQLLGMLEPWNAERMGFGSVELIHLMVEAERRTYADRATHLGDPDFWNVPSEELLNKQYLTARMDNFDPAKATPSALIQAGELVPVESDQTTHFSITDKDGNAVSITTTINDRFGSKIFVSGAGFLLNNEMDDFSAKPGVPNLYGLVGGDANAIEPGKRMLSSMTPTIVEKDGELFMVLGSPGGSRIITSVFQSIVNVIDHGMTMQESVNSPRFHHQWLPDSIRVEKGFPSESVRAGLEAMGYHFYEREAIGRVDAILLREDGLYEGAADPRGDDMALGVE